MKIRLKGICVDINKPKNIERLLKLQTACNEELKSCNRAKREFIKVLLKLINNKLKTMKTVSINSY